MLTALEDYLKLQVPAELFADFERAHNLFDEYDWEHAQTAFEDLLLTTHADPGVSEVHSLTISICQSILNEHQITLTSEATLDNYCKVLEYIKQIEKTEFITESVNMLSTEEISTSELLADHMSLVMGEDSLVYLEFIKYVSPTVISSLKGYFKKREEFEVAIESVPEDVREVYVEMDSFSRIVSGNTMRSYQYLMSEEGIVGMPMEFYWTLNKEYLLTLQSDDFIYELIGFGIMSEGGLDDVINVVMNLITSKFENIDHIEKLRNILTTTLVEYRNEIATGVKKVA